MSQSMMITLSPWTDGKRYARKVWGPFIGWRDAAALPLV
jgi:hypothetical protein